MVPSFRKPSLIPGLGQVTLPWLPGRTVGLSLRISELSGSPPADMCCSLWPLVLWLKEGETCPGTVKPLGCDMTEMWLPEGLHTRQLHLATRLIFVLIPSIAPGLLAEHGWDGETAA